MRIKIIIFILLISNIIYAENSATTKKSLGTIEAGVVLYSVKDNFSVDSQTRLTSEEAPRQSRIVPYFEPDLTFYFDPYVARIGLEDIKVGRIKDLWEFGISSSLKEQKIWEDPFYKGDRRVAVKKYYGGYAKYMLLAGDTQTLDLTYDLHIEQLSSDTTHNDLQRAGQKHIFGADGRYTFLVYGARFIKKAAKGAASSFQQFDMEFGGFIPISTDMLAQAKITYGQQSYDAVNPYFNKKINVKKTKLVSKIVWDKPFGYGFEFLALRFKYIDNVSNQEFYNQNGFAIIATIGAYI